MFLVSACVPLYRPRAQWLDALLRSLAEQECESLEVVLRDDSPPSRAREETAAVVAKWSSAFARLSYAANDATLGMVGNWNATVRASNGALAINVHQDDALLPGMFGAMATEFAGSRSVVVCGVGARYIDEAGAPLPWLPRMDRARIYQQRSRYELSLRDMVSLNLRNGQAFGEPSAVMFRRSAFDAVGGYDEQFEHAADVDFNIRLASVGRAVYLPTPYLLRRMHGRSLTATHIDNGATGRDRVRLFRRYAMTSGLSRAEVARIRTTVTTRFLRDAARAFFRRRRALGWASVRAMSPFWRNRPTYYASHLFELATGKSLDER